MIICKVCNEIICKYEVDWKPSGAIWIDVSKPREQVKMEEVCKSCAIKIAKELLESI